MKISRQVATASQILHVFIQDATVSTGAGLANIVASSVSFGILRNNQATVSSGSCSSGGTLGTYGVSTLTQMSSTLMLGWYQFCPPDYAFASGDSVAIHMYGAPSMAPLPMEVELTKFNNQAYVSTYDIRSVANPVGVSTVTDKAGYGVSSNTDKGNYGVSSIVTVGVSSLAANVITATSISSAALNGKGDWNIGKTGYSASASVSTMATLVGVSTNTDKGNYGVSSIVTVGVSSLATNVLTSTAISSQALAGKGDWSVASGVHVTSYGALVGVSTVTDKAGYGVSSNTDKGNYGVSSIVTVGVSSNADKTGYALTAVYDPAKTASQAGDAMALVTSYGVAGAISTNIAFVKGVAVASGTGTSSNPWGP